MLDELERMLSHPARTRAWHLLGETGLRPYLWPEAAWPADELETIERLLARLPAAAPFEPALAVLLAARAATEIERIARALTLSNEQRETVQWLVAHQADLDDPARPTLAALKRLLAHPAVSQLITLSHARYGEQGERSARAQALAARIAGIPPDQIQPAPLVTGDDLLGRNIPRGRIYGEVLDELYTRQLNEQLLTRDQALTALDELLRARLGPGA